MGSGDTDSSAKAPKSPATQEQPPTTSTAAAYPDWTAFQAYSPLPPHGFFHSPVASSPQAHPYMWGPQHLMPPYGTPPPPYVAMYPHGGIYAHPSMPPGSHPFSPYAMPSVNGNAEASGSVPGVEAEGKSSEGKEKSSLKKSKGSLGSLNLLIGKNNDELAKTSGASANGAVSQSAESASEGSSEGSDANSQNDSQPKTHGQDSLGGEASQNGSAVRGSNNGVPHTPQHAMLNQTMAIMPMVTAGAPGGVAGPATNLNIGMDYWGTPTPAPMPAIRGKVPSTPVAGAVVPTGLVGSREVVQSELWIQDERELKRQRRKQSNRESARRSRLRKQAECEELAQRVEVLKEENSTLKSEVSRIRSEYEQLLSQNASLKERLGESPRGHDGRNDQHSGNDDHEAGQTEQVQSGH